MQHYVTLYLESSASDSQPMSNRVVISFQDQVKAMTERIGGETTEREDRWLRDTLPAILGYY